MVTFTKESWLWRRAGQYSLPLEGVVWSGEWDAETALGSQWYNGTLTV